MQVTILGVGLIGGSIGLAAHALDKVDRVVAYDRDFTTAERAVERGAADHAARTIAEAVENADVIFLAAPVSSIPGILSEAARSLKVGAIVTDVGSTKARVVDEAENLLPEGVCFIGGHPMAGTEDEGIEAAQAQLFDGAWWILTPTVGVAPTEYGRLHELIASFGCHILALEPELHDELTAIISHLPHLTAATLMNMAADHGRERASLLSLAAGGFRDVTRVAASNSTIWIDICRENRDAIVRALAEFEERLSDLRKVIADESLDDLRNGLDRARQARRDLPGKVTSGEIFELLVPIPDRPGVLSEVTTIIGRLGVNIEDLQMSHTEEGGRGLLRLLIIGGDQARKASNALSIKNFNPRVTSL